VGALANFSNYAAKKLNSATIRCSLAAIMHTKIVVFGLGFAPPPPPDTAEGADSALGVSLLY